MSEVTAVAGGAVSATSSTPPFQVELGPQRVGVERAAVDGRRRRQLRRASPRDRRGARARSVAARRVSPTHMTETGTIGSASQTSAATTPAHSIPAGHGEPGAATADPRHLRLLLNGRSADAATRAARWAAASAAHDEGPRRTGALRFESIATQL